MLLAQERLNLAKSLPKPKKEAKMTQDPLIINSLH